MHILLWLTVSVLVLAAGYAVFVALTLGLHERLPLAFRGISIEAIPDRAARYYGKRILFTSAGSWLTSLQSSRRSQMLYLEICEEG